MHKRDQQPEPSVMPLLIDFDTLWLITGVGEFRNEKETWVHYTETHKSSFKEPHVTHEPQFDHLRFMT